MINEEGNDITQELYEYLYPLIQGEVHVTYKRWYSFLLQL